MSTSCN